ncbi:MAG: hypothetical protein ACTHLT_07370, partial [Devosia sp.]
MIHLDIKSLGRIARPSHRVTGNRRDSVEGIGWEHLHVAIDDCSRRAYTEVLDGLGSEQATAFLQRALDWFGQGLGVIAKEVVQSLEWADALDTGVGPDQVVGVGPSWRRRGIVAARMCRVGC